jgi:hypothetical protein
MLFIHYSIFFFFPLSFDAVCIVNFTGVAVWETTYHRLRNSSDLAALVYAMSKHVGTSKWVTPHDSGFEEMLGCLQDGLTDRQ